MRCRRFRIRFILRLRYRFFIRLIRWLSNRRLCIRLILWLSNRWFGIRLVLRLRNRRLCIRLVLWLSNGRLCVRLILRLRSRLCISVIRLFILRGLPGRCVNRGDGLRRRPAFWRYMRRLCRLPGGIRLGNHRLRPLNLWLRNNRFDRRCPCLRCHRCRRRSSDGFSDGMPV